MSTGLNNIEQSLIGLLADKFSITDNFEVINLDSLQLMELAAEIEDKYNISIPLDDVAGIKTVKEAAKLIEKILVDKTSNIGT